MDIHGDRPPLPLFGQGELGGQRAKPALIGGQRLLGTLEAQPAGNLAGHGLEEGTSAAKPLAGLRPGFDAGIDDLDETVRFTIDHDVDAFAARRRAELGGVVPLANPDPCANQTGAGKGRGQQLDHSAEHLGQGREDVIEDRADAVEALQLFAAPGQLLGQPLHLGRLVCNRSRGFARRWSCCAHRASNTSTPGRALQRLPGRGSLPRSRGVKRPTMTTGGPPCKSVRGARVSAVQECPQCKSVRRARVDQRRQAAHHGHRLSPSCTHLLTERSTCPGFAALRWPPLLARSDRVRSRRESVLAGGRARLRLRGGPERDAALPARGQMGSLRVRLVASCASEPSAPAPVAERAAPRAVPKTGNTGRSATAALRWRARPEAARPAPALAAGQGTRTCGNDGQAWGLCFPAARRRSARPGPARRAPARPARPASGSAPPTARPGASAPAPTCRRAGTGARLRPRQRDLRGRDRVQLPVQVLRPSPRLRERPHLPLRGRDLQHHVRHLQGLPRQEHRGLRLQRLQRQVDRRG